MNILRTLLLPCLLAGLPLSALAESNLHLSQPWSRAMPANAPTAAVYFQLHNAGPADRLLAASSPQAGRAELHMHVHQNGLMKMQQVPAVELPAGGSLAFEPMGYHVMLFELPRQARAGEHFPLTLEFEQSPPVTIEVQVLGEAPAPQGHSH